MSKNLSRTSLFVGYNLGVIHGKAGKAAAFPKFSDTLTLCQPWGADHAHPLALPCLKTFCDYTPVFYQFSCHYPLITDLNQQVFVVGLPDLVLRKKVDRIPLF